MQVILYETLEQWLQEGRPERITGSKLKDIVVSRGNEIKDGQYELLADRLSVGYENSSSREEGHQREKEALELFAATYNKKLDYQASPEEPIMMWVDDNDPRIAISPDAGIMHEGAYVEACEVKSLSGKHHLRAIIENKVGSGFKMQAMQYFVVNPDLEKLYFIFYDPRITAKPMHVIEFNRDDFDFEINYYRQYEIDVLEWVDMWAEKLAF